MKRNFILPTIFFGLLVVIFWFVNLSYFCFGNNCVYDIGIKFVQPLFWMLLPLTILLFLCNFLKNIQPKQVLSVIIIFIVIVSVVLTQIPPICSGLICYDRAGWALGLSSIFSIIYFIILLIKNRKTIS